MTLVATPGLAIPTFPPFQLSLTYVSTLLIDLTGEKIAFMGRFWNKDQATKNITKVGFRFGTVVKAGGSALTVSLQDVSLTTGPPTQPDEVQDQTVAIANADAGFTSNVWYQTNALSATRTVAYGDLLAVVIEYDGAGRLGADSVIVTGLQTAGSMRVVEEGMPSLKTGGTWATFNTIAASVILEADDGTFGTLNAPGISNWPTSTATPISFNSGNTPDEYALRFVLQFSCTTDGGWVALTTGTSAADYAIVLYQGTTILATVTVDANSVSGTSQSGVQWAPFPNIALTAGTEYFLAIKPTTANNITINEATVNDANHFQAWSGGTNFYEATRSDAGAWTAAPTKRLIAGLSISQVDIGSGAASLMEMNAIGANITRKASLIGY